MWIVFFVMTIILTGFIMIFSENLDTIEKWHHMMTSKSPRKTINYFSKAEENDKYCIT